MKLEQASKVETWMPTRLQNGEGRAGREETNKHLFRSTGVVSTACRDGDPGNWGRLGTGGESRLRTSPQGWRPDWASERAIRPMRPGNAGGGKGPCFWCACEGGKER